MPSKPRTASAERPGCWGRLEEEGVGSWGEVPSLDAPWIPSHLQKDGVLLDRTQIQGRNVTALGRKGPRY